MREREKKNIVSTVFLSICLFAIIFGGINAAILNRDEEDDALSVQAVLNSGLSLDADVKWQYYYTKCGHTEYVSSEPEDDMIGKTGKEIAQLYDAELVSYKDDNIELKKEINSYCPNHYILKKDGDYISIYTPISGSEELELYIKTEVRFKLLSDDEMKKEIEQGKAFDSIQELESFLEDVDT